MDENHNLTNTSMHNSDDFKRGSDAPPAGQTKLCTSQDSNCDCCLGPEEAAKLDAVLASVHKLIKGLNDEIDDGRTGDHDDDPVAMATEQLSSFHHVTNYLVNWSDRSQLDDDVSTGASKQQVDVKRAADKKNVDSGGERNCNKHNDKKSRFKLKENKENFTKSDFPLISNSKSNIISEGSEVGIKQNQRKHDDSDVNKQMTQGQTRSDCSPNNILLPLMEETELGDDSLPRQRLIASSSKTDSPESEIVVKKANSLTSENESQKDTPTDDEYTIEDERDEFDDEKLETIDENWTSFSAISSAQHLDRIRREKKRLDYIDENELKQAQETERVKSTRIKEFFSQKLSRKSKDSNETISDDSSSDSYIEDVFESTSFKPDPSFIEKVSMSATAKRKTLLSKQKKLFRSIRRSQGKRINSEKQKSYEDGYHDQESLNFSKGTKIEDYQTDKEELKNNIRGKGFMRYTMSEPSGMGQLMRESEKEELFQEIDCDYFFDEEAMTVHRVSSEPKLPPLQESELDNEDEDTSDYRDGEKLSLFSTSSEYLHADFSRRWKSSSESDPNRLFSHHPNMPQRASTGHLERLADSHKEKRYDLSSKGSQDSLDIVLEPITRLAMKFARTKFRNPLKSVGKSSSVPSQDADEMARRAWSYDGDGTWNNRLGKKVELGSTSLKSLSELECEALQKLSLEKLQEAEIGVHIVIPKDDSTNMKRKMSARKRRGMLLVKEKNKEKSNDHVFGIPLLDVVENDQLLRLQKSFSPAMDCPHIESPNCEDHLPIPTRPDAYSSFSSGASSCSGSSSSIHNHEEGRTPEHEEDLHNATSGEITAPVSILSTSRPKTPESDPASDKESLSPTQATTPTSNRPRHSATSQSLRRRDAIAAHSINEIDPDQSKLLEALSLSLQSGTNHSQKKAKDRSMLPPTMAQVPYVVQKCCDHIKKYGLDIEGIFRLAGSRKRIKQLREEFDRGVDVTIDEDYHPNDVAALLKEFFRDLPEALLTRELFPAFIQTTKMGKQQGLNCLRYLLWLLPLSNRDTLYTLLNFLSVVAAHSETACDHLGNRVPGNKMSVYNLAAIFGPNILHRYKNSQAASDSHYQGPSLESAEDTTAGIKVVEELINNQKQLFQIPKEEHDEILRKLTEWNPTAVDYLLRRKAANQTKDSPLLSSVPSIGSNPKTSPAQLTPTYDSYSEMKRKSGNWGDSPITPDHEATKLESDFGKASESGVFVRSSTLRMSYQQATGHLPLPGEDEQDKKELHEKQRQFHKSSQRHFLNNHEKLSSDNEVDAGTDGKNSTCLTVHTHIHVSNRVSEDSTSSGSTKNCRSAHFTDGDVNAIISRTRENNMKRLGVEGRPQVLELKVAQSEKFEVQNGDSLKARKQSYAKHSKREVRDSEHHNDSTTVSSQACRLGPNTYCDMKSKRQEIRTSDENGDCNNNQCMYRAMCAVENHAPTLPSSVGHCNSNSNNNNNNRSYAQQPLHLNPLTVTNLNNTLSPCNQESSPTKRPVPRPRTRLPPSVRNKAYDQPEDGANSISSGNSYPNEFSHVDFQLSRSVEYRKSNDADEQSRRQNAPPPKTARRTKFLLPSENVDGYNPGQIQSSASYAWNRGRSQTMNNDSGWSSYHSDTHVVSGHSIDDRRFLPPQMRSSRASGYGVNNNNNKHLTESLV